MERLLGENKKVDSLLKEIMEVVPLGILLLEVRVEVVPLVETSKVVVASPLDPLVEAILIVSSLVERTVKGVPSSKVTVRVSMEADTWLGELTVAVILPMVLAAVLPVFLIF